MVLSICRKRLLHAVLLCLFAACSTSGGDPVPGDDGTGPRVPEKSMVFTNAHLIYYGFSTDTPDSNEYELSFYTDMELDQLGNPIGPGKLLRLSINGKLFDEGVTDLSLPDGEYIASSASYVFDPWTFNDGFMYLIDLPTGKIEVPMGSFYGEVAAGSIEFTPDLIESGKFTVVRKGDIFEITGVVSGTNCLKRNFVYKGKLPVIDRSDNPVQTPNSNLTADVNFTPAKARLQDAGSFFMGDESVRVFELYLGASDLNLTPQWPLGSGHSLKISFFVAWTDDAAAGIPAGVYTVVRQHETGGVYREDMLPGGIVPGVPDRFTYPDGSWYHLFENGSQKEYARITGGTMTVVRNGDAHQITFDLIDCDTKTPHHIKGSYSQQTPIPIFTL